jgi:hypothetical protein
MFGCPLKFILGFFDIFGYKSKCWYTIKYAYKKPPISHELSEIGLLIFFHLNYFEINVICKK